MQRREFVKAGAGAVAMLSAMSACTPKSQSRAAATNSTVEGSQRLAKIGLQLSTVTTLMLRDFEGTLKWVAGIGYDQVEFSALGFLGRDTTAVRKLLAELNLEAPQGRVSPVLPSDFMGLPRDKQMAVYRERARPEYLLDNVAYSLEAATELGQRYLILPAMMPDSFQSLKQVTQNIELINQAGEMCHKQGVVFGYHNHNWEFSPLEGVIPYDLMLESTDPESVTFQLDAYWVAKAGGDLSQYIAQFPGRFSSCHMKDIDSAGDFADVGDGLIDFPRFTRQALAAGSQYFFVERDNPPNPAESIQRSYTYLRQMTF